MIPLESTKLFSSLAPKDLEIVRRAVREIAFSPGQEIFKEGAPGDGVYLVKSGLVQISAVLHYGNRVVLAQIGPGDLFGEMAVLDQNPRSATALAQQATELYFIPRAELLRMLESIPRLSAFFVREISQRLRDFNAQYIREVLQSERLALVGRFASSIVHDLKNPLNIIGLSAEMAAMNGASPEARSVATTRIRHQVDRIGTMVNELLDFARGSQPSTILTPVDFAHVIEGVLEEILPDADLNSVAVEIESPAPSVSVQINPARLYRVFHNLIRNAFDAMEGREGSRLILRFRKNDKDILTEIQDNGRGIAPEIANNLFEPFTTHGKSHGTGLGLTICKKIIEDHHGKIFTRKPADHGAIFGFTLPIVQS